MQKSLFYENKNPLPGSLRGVKPLLEKNNTLSLEGEGRVRVK